MFQKGLHMTIIILFLIGLLLSLNAPNLTQAQDVKTLAKEANNELRNSQKMMFNGKMEEAQEHLNNAAELIEKIKTLDPNFNQLKSLERKYEKQKKDLEKRLGKKTSSGTKPATQPKETGKPSGSNKLPGGVTHRLKDIDRILQRGDRVLTKKTTASDDWKAKELESVIAQANGIMDEIMKRYGDQIPPDHPEMKEIQDKITAFQGKLNEFKGQVAEQKSQAAQAQAKREAQSQEWFTKIKPYITGLGQPGYDEAKYLIPSGTENVEELLRRKGIYDEAAALFAEYKKADFPQGKTDELEQAEKDLVYALDGFTEGYNMTVEGFFTKAAQQIEHAEQWLINQEAKDDGKSQPVMLHKNVITGIKNALTAFAATAPENDPRVKELNEKLAAIEKRAGKLRQLNKERILMTPDQFTGPELEELKSKAVEILQEAYSDANVLRTTIISKDWKEEQVLEYTDTTKTVLRYRVTRSVTAQIAGKRGNEVFLYTIDISKDKQSDDSWGNLYGHIMFIDPMLEENVNK